MIDADKRSQAAKRAAETARAHREARRNREAEEREQRQRQISTLRAIRDDESSNVADRLRAVELLMRFDEA